MGCAAKVSPQLLERYAMCSARWIQCEEMTNRMGFLSKHPTTQKPIPSPFINIGINYMNQAVRLWNEIFQIVKENCSTDYGEVSPQDDLMERLLRARKGVKSCLRKNPCHPDKVADRIAGALVDAAYRKRRKSQDRRGGSHRSRRLPYHCGNIGTHLLDEVKPIVHRIAGNLHTDYVEVPQDGHLANNQADGIRCGDNGIFKGMPVTEEQKALCEIAKSVYHTYPSDGKYISDEARLILCQSNAPGATTLKEVYPHCRDQPPGRLDRRHGCGLRRNQPQAGQRYGRFCHGRRPAWERPLQSGCVGQHLRLAESPGNGKPVELCCAIGDDTVDGIPLC